jgi:hypothetical protein
LIAIRPRILKLKSVIEFPSYYKGDFEDKVEAHGRYGMMDRLKD